MFISTIEKVSILRRLVVLEEGIKQLTSSLNALHDAKTIASDPTKLKERKTSGWTEEARARYSERLKNSWASRKTAKAAA